LRRELARELPVLVVLLILLGHIVVARYQLEPLRLYAVVVEVYLAQPGQLRQLRYRRGVLELPAEFVTVGPFFLLLRNVGHHRWKRLLLHFLHYP